MEQRCSKHTFGKELVAELGPGLGPGHSATEVEGLRSDSNLNMTKNHYGTLLKLQIPDS